MSLQNVNPSLTYEVKVEGACAGIKTLNVFNYVTSEAVTVNDLGDFIALFAQNVLTKIGAILSVSAAFTNVVMTSLDNSVFREVAINVVGDVPTQSLPPFVVWPFRFTKSVGGVRGGYKRFSGIPENYTANGLWEFGTGVQPHVDAVCSALSGPGNVGGKAFEPVVIVRTFNGQPLPTAKYWSPTGCVLAPRPGSQNTRKK